MPKSKYPNELDTSVEIPVIRDNITEIGSDVFNSLRSAIFNIEKALGINPQGATGNTVSARLSNALDENGNILKEALDRSNVLSGPVTDTDVSKVAAINESKLRLNFPTHLLQDQISILDNRLDAFIITLEELNAIVSAHVHDDAINRHYAKAIAVEAAEAEESSDATMALGEGSLQEILEEIYNAHMNYTGESIGANNNSHIAGQIYYSNEETSDLISSSSVQGAIDDLAELEGEGLRNSNLNFNSNGIIRTGSSYNAWEGNEIGTLLTEASEIIYDGPNDKSTSKVSFSTPPTPTTVPKPFDILTVVDSSFEEDNIEYLIASVSLSDDGDVEYVMIFGGPVNEVDEGTTAKITKNQFVNYNENGFNCSVRPRYQRSNTPDVQVALPNAATIISSGIKPTSLEDGVADMIALEIDGGDTVEITVYDEDFDIQSLDTIVFKINDYAVSNNLNIFAYKIRALRCYELAISHVLPSFAEDSKNRTIKLVEATTDAAEVLGMSYLLDREVEGTGGNAYHLNGRLLEDFGKIKKYGSDSISIAEGTMYLSSVSTDFIADDIRTGDLCVIDGSTDSGDDGTFRIRNVSANTIILDPTSGTPALQGEISDDSSVFVIRCTAPIGEMEFLETDGLIMFDVFVDQNKDIFYKRKLDTIGHIETGDFYAIVSDVSGGFIQEDDIYVVTITTEGMAYLSVTIGDPYDISPGSEGEEVFVGATGEYKVFSKDKMSYIVLDVLASGPPLSEQTSVLIGHDDLPSSVLHLCRGVYSASFGFILGSASETGGAVPTVRNKRVTGTVDDTIIGEAFLERYIQGPRNELRTSGVIRATDIDSITYVDSSTCKITINPGVAVVNGVRFEYLGVTDLVYKYDGGVSGYNDTDNFYIALDGSGCIIIENEIDREGDGITAPNYVSPFAGQAVANLAYVEVDTSGETTTVTDLRLFIDHIDYKLIGDITVANDQRFGHFTDIKAAVDYARMFSKLFPDMGTPNIFLKEGTYNVSETIVIDFDLILSGAGPNTIISRASESTLAPGGESGDAGAASSVFFIGSTTSNTYTPAHFESSDYIVHGVTLKDFTYKQTDEFLYEGCVIQIVQETDSSHSLDAMFRVSNVNFIALDMGDETGVSTWVDPVEHAVRIGRGSGLYFGNLIIKGCYFNFMGRGFGAVYFDASNTFTNVIITENVQVNTIPADAAGGVPSTEARGIGDVPSLGWSTFYGYVESNNISDDQY